LTILSGRRFFNGTTGALDGFGGRLGGFVFGFGRLFFCVLVLALAPGFLG